MPSRSASKRRLDPQVAARRAAQKELILDAADAVLRRAGPGASVGRIAAEAGVAKPIVYRHFEDKSGLYQALAERYVTALLEQLRAALAETADPRRRLAATIRAYLSFVEEHREQYDFLMRRAVRDTAATQETVAGFIQQVAAEVASELGEELRAAQVDSGGAEPWAHGIVGMVQLAGDWWLRTGTMPRERLVEYLTDLLWDGFTGITANRDRSARS
jgi:AcrR family transcriptional regulator